MLKRTVISDWSFVIGEKKKISKPSLIGWGCQPPPVREASAKIFY
jgi:hypothetical protein